MEMALQKRTPPQADGTFSPRTTAEMHALSRTFPFQDALRNCGHNPVVAALDLLESLGEWRTVPVICDRRQWKWRCKSARRRRPTVLFPRGRPGLNRGVDLHALSRTFPFQDALRNCGHNPVVAALDLLSVTAGNGNGVAKAHAAAGRRYFFPADDRGDWPPDVKPIEEGLNRGVDLHALSRTFPFQDALRNCGHNPNARQTP
jgi:hypothetical protein